MIALAKAANMLKNKEISPLELSELYLQQIEKNDSEIGAYISINGDARKMAHALENSFAKDNNILWAIPYALKDNFCTQAIKTTCASKMLANFIPPYDATAYSILKQKDSLLLGKLNMDEFAMGSSSQSSAFKSIKNPNDLSRVPGGSSGGSAAAVKAQMALFALGTDTGGSIRQPAAHCGVVGLKPSYGRISRFGVVSYASSLDTVGIIANTVEDSAHILQALSGQDKKDASSLNAPCDNYIKWLDASIKGIKIGIPEEYLMYADECIRDAIKTCAKKLEAMGAIIELCSLSPIEHGAACYAILSCAEASSNLSRFDGIIYGVKEKNIGKMRAEYFGNEVIKRILTGKFALTGDNARDYFIKAQRLRGMIKNSYQRAFEKFDLLLTPTTPTTAWKIGESPKKEPDGFTIGANLASCPAISIPCGNEKGLPIGAQLIGQHLCERQLLTAANALEKAVKYGI